MNIRPAILRVRSKRLAARLALTALMLGAIMLTAGPAHAEWGHACGQSFLNPHPADSGGYDAKSWRELSHQDCTPGDQKPYGGLYAEFDAYDEVLWIKDRRYYISWVELRVYNRDWKYVESDTLDNRVDRYEWDKHQLGTPDGSGNIPEGYFVKFRVCGWVAGGSECGEWVWGKA